MLPALSLYSFVSNRGSVDIAWVVCWGEESQTNNVVIGAHVPHYTIKKYVFCKLINDVTADNELVLLFT